MTTPSFFGYLLSPKIIAKTTWEEIGNFERKTIPESATIATFNLSPAIDFDNVSMLVLEFDGAFDLATNLLLSINGINSNYAIYGRRIKAGVKTLIQFTNQAFETIASNNLVTANNDILHSLVYMTVNKAPTFKEVGFQIFSNGLTVNGNEVLSGSLNFVAGIITINQVIVSSGGWQVGTRITLYKVNR